MAAFADWAPQQKGLILDGCAGPGGWSEGIRRWLGLHDVGLEWDEAACLTRKAAGHATIRVDVSSFVLTPLVGRVWGLLFSPPCTKFSASGKQFGMLVIDLLAAGIRRTLRGEDCRAELREQIYPIALAEQEAANTKREDSKRWSQTRMEAAARDDAFVTVLMLEPARYLSALITGDTSEGTPLEWAAFEQVPGVLTLWQVYAQALRELGWSVWAGVLNAADYGVPQTRERAVLIASRSRRVSAPAPLHAEYAADDLFGGRVESWVTMAEALGWPGGVDVNTRGERRTSGGNNFSADGPSWAVTEKARSWWVLRHSKRSNATTRRLDQPAATLVAGHARRDYRWETVGGGPVQRRALALSEAALLQSFPGDHPFQGSESKAFQQIANAVPPLLAGHVVSAASGVSFVSALEVAA